MLSTISTPPMLGVPVLAWWLSGTSSRTRWPAFSERRRAITHGPNRNAISSAVIAA